MSTMLVAYYSRTGNTRTMAEEIARGAQQAGAKVDVRGVENVAVDMKQRFFRYCRRGWCTG